MLVMALGFGTSVLCGCHDGPFYAMKKVNPYFLSKWRADRQLGPTYEDRLQELRELNREITSLAPSEQEDWAARLEQMVQKDPSPEIRSWAVRCLAQIDSPASTRGLNMASTDDVEKVRLIACSAWRIRGGEPAKNMLLSLAREDESSSVRQAAIESLAAFNEPEVLQSLGNLLEDRSPAIQVSVARSLAGMTGRDLGVDIEAWQSELQAMGINRPSSMKEMINGTPPDSQAVPNVQLATGENKIPGSAVGQ
jgi:hypothetical protein